MGPVDEIGEAKEGVCSEDVAEAEERDLLDLGFEEEDVEEEDFFDFFFLGC